MTWLKDKISRAGNWPLLILFVLCAIAYLPLIGSLTYYGDDWHILWEGHTFGAAKIALTYSIDRPFVGLVHAFNYLYLNDSPLAWHIYNFLVRLLGGLVFYALVRSLWPGYRKAAMVMTLVFLLYPGYLSMPNANTYQTLLTSMTFGLISILCSVRALLAKKRSSQIILMALSALFAAGEVFMFEWMIGAEGLRFLLIWYMTGREQKRRFFQQVKAVALRWLPALVAVGAFLVWRVFFFKNLRGATDIKGLALKYLADPLGMILNLVTEFISSLGQTIASAWLVPLYNRTLQLQFWDMLLVVTAGLLAFGITWAAVRSQPPAPEKAGPPEGESRAPLHMLLIGFLSICIALLPVVVSDRGVGLAGNTYDRYTLTSMAGVALIAGGAIWYLIESDAKRAWAVALLAGLAVMTQIANAMNYRNVTSFQQQFWWQLSWRAPDIQNGTVLMPYLQKGMRFFDDYDSFPEANFIYRPGVQDIQVGTQVLNTDTAKQVTSGAIEDRLFRTMNYTRDYSKLLLVTYGYDSGAPTCLHAWDGALPELSQNEDPLVAQVARYSVIDRIDANAAGHTPPAVFFGPEPPHTWCYFYEKASLARQQGDWEGVVRLGEQAASLNYTASDPVEWLPFIEASASLGQKAKMQVFIQRMQKDQNVTASICRVYASAPIPARLSPEVFQTIKANLCAP